MLLHTQPSTILPKSSTPWKYLEYASVTSLQGFELNRLNHAANLMKEIQALLQQYLDDTAAANVARIFMQQRAASPTPSANQRQSSPQVHSIGPIITLPPAT